MEVAEGISGKLSYFTELERIGSRVNALSQGSVDAPTSLLAILPRLDECILFIEKNVSGEGVALRAGLPWEIGGRGWVGPLGVW